MDLILDIGLLSRRLGRLLAFAFFTLVGINLPLASQLFLAAAQEGGERITERLNDVVLEPYLDRVADSRDNQR